jgi:hypothetical protein
MISGQAAVAIRLLLILGCWRSELSEMTPDEVRPQASRHRGPAASFH